jgi:hypothetical protein
MVFLDQGMVQNSGVAGKRLCHGCVSRAGRKPRHQRHFHSRLTQPWHNLLLPGFEPCARANHLDSISGIGAVTAAVLTAFILDIGRFEDPGKLVAYFGVLPIEVSSGVERDGTPRAARRYVMSKRGNDLVRRYLWMAALSAVQVNPAVRALYRRVVARHPENKVSAIGHALRKLLHLAFALWKSDRPFDPTHHPWEEPAGSEESRSDSQVSMEQTGEAVSGEEGQAAGHKPEVLPAEKVVTAACEATVASASEVGEGMYLDFAHLKSQLPLARLLDQLGVSARRRGAEAVRLSDPPR